ncbi:MAG: GntR family transcriptional regulator [Firmicutes bacterium]|nr:GntR family transcriptional regulator [Bacillota bacterium]NLP37284.1 GntR family transcriptional regulator [Bacillota bacterium]
MLSIIIANSAEKPIYQQIVDQITEQIIQGELTAGEMLPSIRALAKELKVSVITTKRAYEELERAGYIETVVGKGTFVSGMNKELIRERQMGLIENELTKIIKDLKRLGLSKKDLQYLVDLLWD